MSKSENSYRCPYCWTENKIKDSYKGEISGVHPPNFRNNIYPPPFPFFWNVQYPKKTCEKVVECSECRHIFHVEYYPYKIGDKRYSRNMNYYLSLGLGKTKSIERKFFLINIIDRFSKRLGVNYAIGSFLFLLIPAIITIMSYIYTGTISVFLYDTGYFILFTIFVIILILLKKNYTFLKNSFNCSKLPLLLHKKYKMNKWCTVLEELSFRGPIFGHPYSKIKGPTISGFLAVCIYNFFTILYYPDVATVFLSKLYETSPPDYIVLLTHIFAQPYWIIIYFIIGNVIWIFISTIALIWFITNYIPIDIDVTKSAGGTEIFGEILLNSLYPVAAIGVCTPILMFWSSGVGIPVLIISGIFTSIFIFLVIFGFLLPLIPLYKNLKKQKSAVLNKLLTKYLNFLSNDYDIDKAKLSDRKLLEINLALNSYNQISSEMELPFKLNTGLKLFLVVIFQLSSFFIQATFFLI